MIYVYKDRNGDHNVIAEGTVANKPIRKVRKNAYGVDEEYMMFELLYGFDKKCKQKLIIWVCLYTPPSVRANAWLKRNDRVVLFGLIRINKNKSNKDGRTRYEIHTSTCLPLNEVYKLIVKNHEDDNIETKLMAEYKKKARRADQINMLGEADVSFSESDVLL